MRDQPVVRLDADEVDGPAVAAVRDDPLQGLADARRDLGGLGAAGDGLAHDGLHVGIAQYGQGSAQRGRQLGRDPVGVRGLGQPGAEAATDAEGVEPGPDHVGGEEVLPDELAQRDAELVLLGRDDRGVRDGQAERAPEERGDGEPVRERADHAGLGRGGDVRGPAAGAPGVLGVLGQYVDQRDQDQQTGRGGLHPADAAAALLVGGAEHERSARGDGVRSGGSARGAVPVVVVPFSTCSCLPPGRRFCLLDVSPGEYGDSRLATAVERRPSGGSCFITHRPACRVSHGLRRRFTCPVVPRPQSSVPQSVGCARRSGPDRGWCRSRTSRCVSVDLRVPSVLTGNRSTSRVEYSGRTG